MWSIQFHIVFFILFLLNLPLFQSFPRFWFTNRLLLTWPSLLETWSFSRWCPWIFVRHSSLQQRLGYFFLVLPLNLFVSNLLLKKNYGFDCFGSCDSLRFQQPNSHQEKKTTSAGRKWSVAIQLFDEMLELGQPNKSFSLKFIFSGYVICFNASFFPNSYMSEDWRQTNMYSRCSYKHLKAPYNKTWKNQELWGMAWDPQLQPFQPCEKLARKAGSKDMVGCIGHEDKLPVFFRQVIIWMNK